MASGNPGAVQVDPDAVFAIAGFAAFVMCCSPAGMRLVSAPHEAMLPVEAKLLDRAGQFDPAPPELGEKSVTELIEEGSLFFEIDARYPQAISIQNLIGQVAAYCNFHWDILLNQHLDTPFFPAISLSQWNQAATRALSIGSFPSRPDLP